MESSSEVQLDDKRLSKLDEDESELSDDCEVSVANMERYNSKIAVALTTEDIGANPENLITEGDDEIVSDHEYTYSDDSICSDDDQTCRDSDMTNVTPRSSLGTESPLNHTISLDYSSRIQLGAIPRVESTPPQYRSANSRDDIRRMCASANDNRYSIGNNLQLESIRTRTRRRNMSFTNEEMRKIERENQYLLKKIMSYQKPKNKPMRVQSVHPKVSSSAINRKKLQKKIEEDNMVRNFL